jgi:anti-anti-sigma factor
MTSNTPGFSADTSFEGSAATVVLRGTFENLAAFQLGDILDAAIDRQPTSMVLDLAELNFMGAAGLVAVSNAEKRLAALGVTLTIKSPSTLVNRLVDTLHIAEMTKLERGLAEHGHLGPEQLSLLGAVTQRFGSTMSSRDLRRVTALPADPDVVDGALRLIVELTRTGIDAADGVSVSLLRHGVLSTVAATDHTIMAMDADQYATREGPCVDASLKGHWFHAESLDDEIRWPAFTPRARALGIRAILSSPLTSFEEPIGALNIYSRTVSPFEIHDQERAAAFAQMASEILSDARASVSDTQVAVRFQEALRSRAEVSLAKGIIMERDGIGEEDAFTALLRASHRNGEPIRQRAAAIVRSVGRPQLELETDPHG